MLRKFWEVGMSCRSSFLGGALHRSQLVRCRSIRLSSLLKHVFLHSQKLKRVVWRCRAQTWPSWRMWMQWTGLFCFPKCLWRHERASSLSLILEFWSQTSGQELQHLSGQQFGGSCNHPASTQSWLACRVLGVCGGGMFRASRRLFSTLDVTAWMLRGCGWGNNLSPEAVRLPLSSFLFRCFGSLAASAPHSKPLRNKLRLVEALFEAQFEDTKRVFLWIFERRAPLQKFTNWISK